MDSKRDSSLVRQDAHTEANIGWLEPMLYELKKHPDSIVQPFVDGIDAGSIEYTAPGEIYTGSFSWDLRFVDPLKSVTTVMLTSRQGIQKK